MTLRGVFALAVFAILCICRGGAAHQVNCSGRVTFYTDIDTLKMMVLKRTIEALSAVSSSKINMGRIQTLNQTIVSRMEGAAYDLSSLASPFTNEEKKNLANIAKEAEQLYKRIGKYDLDGFNAGIKNAEALLMSIKDESEETLCMAEDAFVLGDGIQSKVKPIHDQYQEVYATLETFQKTAKDYASSKDDRAAQ